MRSPLVSILIPLYNEEEYIATVLERVMAASLPPGMNREVIVVDDGSTDDSASIVEQLCTTYGGTIRIVRTPKNRGKGAAIRLAIEYASGEYCLVQDADLEYNPKDYNALLQPLVDDIADVVYGSRFATVGHRRVLYFWHSVANHVLTTACNIVSDLNLTDMETGYKAFRTSLLKTIPIRSERFGIEPELTIKLAKRQMRFYEVPISYEGRTYEDGKKIRSKDAVQALYVILHCWFINDLYKDPGAEILDAFSVAPRFNRWMAQTIQPFVGTRVLEIGAGMGNLTKQLSKGRERYVATDINTEHLVRLQNRLRHRTQLEVSVCDLSKSEDFDIFENSMDTVICLNVLEHMKHDRQCLQNICRALRPGGRAIVLVPHGQGLFGQLDVVLGHLRRYSCQQLRETIEAAGLQVERIVDFNRVSRPGWYLTGKVLKRSRLNRWSLKLFDRFVWLWSAIDQFLPWKSVSIIAIGIRQDRTET